jgi:hypothetical protein
MPDPNSANTPAQQTGLAILDKAILATGQINILIPAAAFAIKQLYMLLKRDNPNLTPEQYYEYLRSEGHATQTFSADWLTSKGYTQTADGTWQAPPTPSIE